MTAWNRPDLAETPFDLRLLDWLRDHPGRSTHQVLVYYEGCEEPEIWHLPPGHRLRVGPIRDDQRVVKIEVWETPEYEAEKAAGWVTRERLFDQNPAHPVSEAR